MYRTHNQMRFIILLEQGVLVWIVLGSALLKHVLVEFTGLLEFVDLKGKFLGGIQGQKG